METTATVKPKQLISEGKLPKADFEGIYEKYHNIDSQSKVEHGDREIIDHVFVKKSEEIFSHWSKDLEAAIKKNNKIEEDISQLKPTSFRSDEFYEKSCELAKQLLTRASASRPTCDFDESYGSENDAVHRSQTKRKHVTPSKWNSD